MDKSIQSKNVTSCIRTVNKLFRKDNFRTFCPENSQRERMIEASKQKILTIYQFNECYFYFEHAGPFECEQHNSFESFIMSS